MNEEERAEEAELTNEELEGQSGEELPDRIAMTIIDANIAIPVDPAIAADVLADEPTAAADAEQDAEIDQGT